VADDDVFRADIFQHFSGGFTGECARQVHVNVLRAQNDVAASAARLARSRYISGGAIATHSRYASQLFTQVRNQFVYHVAAAVQFPVTHH
jgi:hypothetical protein